MAADGTITLNTKVNTSGITSGANTIKKALAGIAGTVSFAFAIRELIQFGKEAMDVASDLAEVQNVVDVAFGSMSYKIENFTKTSVEQFGMTELVAKKAGSSYMAMGKGIGLAEEQASNMAITLTGLTGDMASFYNVTTDEAQTALASVFTGETESLKKYGILLTETNLQEYARQQGITKTVSAMNQQEKVLLRYNYIMQATSLAQGDFARTANSWANQTRVLSAKLEAVKAEFGEAFIEIAQLVLPALNKVLDCLSQIAQMAQNAARSIASVFGKELDTTSGVQKNVSATVASQNALTDAVKETNKAVQKSIAGFDDINILSGQSADAQSASSTGGADLSAGDSTGISAEAGGADSLAESYNQISSTLAELMVIVGASLIAIGLILLFFGNIPWGLGFIVMGVVAVGVTAMSATSANISDETRQTILDVMAAAIIAFVAIGLILMCFGLIPLGLGFLAAGALLLGIYALAYSKFDTAGISQTMMNVMEIAGAFLLAIGIVLLCTTGPNPISIGAVVMGAALLITPIALNISKLPEDTRRELATMMAIVGGALVVLGVILVCCGAIPLGIALIVAGAASIAAAFVINKDAVLDFIKEIWDGIKYWWDGNVKPVFTKSFWTDKWKTIKEACKMGLNGLIGIINKGIDGINKILYPIRTIVAGAAKIFGGDIEVEDVRIPHIPKLARGAVIPPNKEFMAILGDQKNGTNIETPLETMIQAFKTALSENGGGSSNVILEIDGREFGRAVVKFGKQETTRVGTSLCAR